MIVRPGTANLLLPYEHGWILGCKFLRTPSANVLHLLG